MLIISSRTLGSLKMVSYLLATSVLSLQFLPKNNQGGRGQLALKYYNTNDLIFAGLKQLDTFIKA